MNKKIISMLLVISLILAGFTFLYFRSNRNEVSASKAIEMIGNCDVRAVLVSEQAGTQIYTKDDETKNISIDYSNDDYKRIVDTVDSNPGNCEPAPGFGIE